MSYKEFASIPGYSTWVSVEKINKGFSGEDKYLVVDNKGNKYLLRIAPIASYEERKGQYDLLEKIAKLNINASKPICFGKLNEEKITTLMITHNMRDAIKYGNRLIMLSNGKIILDVKGEEKQNLTIDKLIKMFENTTVEFTDAMLLSK